MRKIFFVFFLEIIFLLILSSFFTPKARAVLSSYFGGTSYYAAGSAPTTSCSNPVVCSTQPQPSCWNNEAVNTTNCGYACSAGSLWSKYALTPYCVSDPNDPPPPGYDEVCVWAYVQNSTSCSTADKYNSSNTPVLNAGFCDCTVGGGYKTCCSNGSAVPANPIYYNPPQPNGLVDADCSGAYLCGQTVGSNTVVCCGGAGQPACGAPACAGPATPGPTATPTPPTCQGTALSCTNPQCQSGYTAVKITNGNYVCANTSTGQIDCNVIPYCLTGCPTTPGYTGQSCACGSGNVARACATNSGNKCPSCSLDYCVSYTPGLCCYYHDATCFNDSTNCGTVGCNGGGCPPNSTRTTCNGPNACVQ